MEVGSFVGTKYVVDGKSVVGQNAKCLLASHPIIKRSPTSLPGSI
jgi:hypothetical protein